ncbi:hypothetical protein K1T71_015209 [Dendrolimus kikuchii]|nr:hypothetical protein K1T71_015209 [Dendrolimus kikuchii]
MAFFTLDNERTDLVKGTRRSVERKYDRGYFDRDLWYCLPRYNQKNTCRHRSSRRRCQRCQRRPCTRVASLISIERLTRSLADGRRSVTEMYEFEEHWRTS